MKDIYKELLEQSYQDAFRVVENLNQEYDDVVFGDDLIEKGGMALFQYRAQKAMMDYQQAKAEAQAQAQMPEFPDGDGREVR